MPTQVSSTMGFVDRFYPDARTEPSSKSLSRASSFEHVTDAELEAHLEVGEYGSFQLTGAVRPSYDLRIVPRQGYRFDVYRDEEAKTDVPVLMAAASSEILFDLFVEMLGPLGSPLDVVIETSHNPEGGRQDLYREHIDVPVLTSILCDFEDLLLNDGCTGIAVLNPAIPQEVQFDEHKLLIVYGDPLDPFEQMLQRQGVPLDPTIRFITEAEHVHSSSDDMFAAFGALQTRLGIESDSDQTGGELDMI